MIVRQVFIFNDFDVVFDEMDRKKTINGVEINYHTNFPAELIDMEISDMANWFKTNFPQCFEDKPSA